MSTAAAQDPGTGKRVALVAGPLLAAGLMVLARPEGLSAEGWRVLAIAAWMALWWMSEAVPLAVTPPNAIVFSSRAVSTRQMLKAGAVLDGLAIAVVVALAGLLAPVVFDLG